MVRALLSYQGDSIELPPGHSVVGRGIGCRIRFNDPSVSREHLRFELDGEHLRVEDLGSSNGTMVNGKRITEARSLSHGDIVRVGRRVLTVVLEREANQTDSSAAETSRHAVLPEEADAGRQVAEINCPRCRAWISADADRCPSCGNSMAPGRPTSRTRLIKPEDVKKERRMGRRYETATPIFYTSESLAIDAQAHDLSLSGVFVATDLLDDIGSECSITLLPDGGAPVHVSGIVRRVVEGEGTAVSGMGVEFRSITPNAEKWLIAHLQKIAG